MSLTKITARHKVAIAAALGAGIALAPAAQALGSPGERQDLRLAGTWQVTVDPGAPGGGDTFESTLSYSGAEQVMESTSLRPGVTEGLGSWEQVDRTTFRMMFKKYAFQNGAYAGDSVVRETITLVDRDTYEGVAVTTITDPAGNTVATIPSRTTASRLTP